MRDPYEVLGVPRGSSSERIDEAYRQKSREYSSSGNTAAMNELNAAYDSIVMGMSGNSFTYTGTGFEDIRSKLNSGRLDDAQVLLDGMPEEQRNAEWYYLRGTIYERKGWLDRASECYARASSAEPGNREYRSAYDRAQSAGSGGYRTSENRRSSSSGKRSCGPLDGDMCDLCLMFACIDSCLDCSGSDCNLCCC